MSDWDSAIHDAEDLFHTASLRWGGDAQMNKAAEEFAELAAECNRSLNGQGDKQEFLEELVDARVMIEQVAQHITDEALEEMTDEKLDQLAARLEMDRSEEAVDDE